MKSARQASDPDSPKAAYSHALRWLTAREMSEAQLRERLAGRGYSEAAISTAIDRLLEDRTLDDRRAAAAVGRTEARVRRHGPRRVLAKLLAMRVDRDLAKQVVRDLFEEADEQSLLQGALARRLRGKPERLKDPRERRKIHAALVRQGFSASAATSVMRKRLKPESQ